MRHIIIPESFDIIWRIRLLIPLAVLFFISGALFLFIGFYIIPIVIILLIIFFFTIFYYIPNFRKKQSILYKDNKIFINRGVWFKKNIIIQIKAIQFYKQSISPLEKILNLSTIHFYMAGSRNIISCIKQSDILYLCYIIDKYNNIKN